MCGIAGVFRTAPGVPGDSEAVVRMLAAQVHRGPDGEGLFQDSHAVLGHRRLSIIDLSDDGRQPMSNEDGSLHVTFNGEIYNFQDLRSELLKSGHTFQSRTDTEVLLHGYEQWGIAGLLERLRGMFAFALYDVRRGLIIARDRLGIKPLYYHAGADFLVFASEVKALLRSGLVRADRDRNALTGFLIAGAVPAPLTFVKDVQCLPAGHWAECGDGETRVHQYWNFDNPPSGREKFDAEELASTLRDAVRMHMIADVPLGVFLSGGVDSAGLVALASGIRGGDSLTTLTVVFDEKEYSEADPAAEIARRFGTAHRQIRVTGENFERGLPQFLKAMDQPTNDGVNSWFVSKAARDAGLKVVLSGLGGDEVFWGYKHYKQLRSGNWAMACPAPIRRLAAHGGHAWGWMRGRDNWMRTAWLHSGASSEFVYLTLRGFFAPDRVARLLDMTRAELNAAVEEHFGRLSGGAAPGPEAINYLEMKRYLHDQLLRDTDVFSMAHSIEARVPYLDHAIVEQLWNAGAELKLDKVVNKPLLVNAVNDAAVLAAGSRAKRGFTFPMAGWMKKSAPQMREMAEGAALARSAVRECWGDFSAGRMHWSRAWALTVLGASAV